MCVVMALCVVQVVCARCVVRWAVSESLCDLKYYEVND